MTNNLNFKVGELLVRNGKVLQVSQISKTVAELKPYFNLNSSNDLTYIIQLDNPNNAAVRRLTTKDQLKKILDEDMLLTLPEQALDSAEAKSGLSHSLLKKTLKLIKILWLEKQSKGSVLPGGKLTLYQQALIQAGDEIAAVKKITPDAAKTLILSILKKHSSN